MLKVELIAELRNRYAEPHRTFHTWDRIGELLQMAEDVVDGIAGRSALILAILFHKAVFDTRSAESPIRSAVLMRELVGKSVPLDTLDRAEALIMAMARREIPKTNDSSLRGDAALLLDFDHAILGSDEGRFASYEAALGRESAHLPPERYRAARSAALQILLWEKRIFRTDRFFLEREKRARRNIKKAIADMHGA